MYELTKSTADDVLQVLVPETFVAPAMTVHRVIAIVISIMHSYGPSSLTRN